MANDKAKVRSLPVDLWPAADQDAWVEACRPSVRLRRGGAGGHLKPVTLNDLARRYGYFLDHLDRRGELDLIRAAAAHITPEHVDTYLTELRDRVSSVTQYGSIYKLRRAGELLDAKASFGWLTDIEKDLEMVMRPRSKTNRLVLTEKLVEAGLTLIAEAENSSTMTKIEQSRQFRNGLMVAMLAMHSIRLKNFAELEIGHNFIEINGSWWIALPASQTKEKRADERRVDDLLRPALDRYLQKHRAVLRAAGQSTAALWLSSNGGKAMSYDGVARAITETTRSTVGAAVSVHLFRSAMATSAAIHGGATPHLASALLHHTDNRVTEVHYNRASSLSAGQYLRNVVRRHVKDDRSKLA
jgi:site-specific recombinase XerD